MILTACLSVCLTAGMAVSCVAQEITRGSVIIAFDIPAQPLAGALDAFSAATGMAGLVDQQLVAGRLSAGVKGRLTPDQALRILLAGTKLSIRYAGTAAFTLGSIDGAETPDSPNGGVLPAAVSQAYFSDLQAGLTQLFCRRPETQPGGYRLGLQVWVAANGSVLASHLLASTGDGRRDAVITDLLGSATLAAPPAELPQPITLVLLPHAAEQRQDCNGPEGAANDGNDACIVADAA